jgi:predicted dehydrogenase
MSTPLKVGVFGVGSLGQWHARVYHELEQADLVGVYDLSPTRAKEIADRYNTRAFSSIEALAAEVDAASIAVPTDKHHDLFGQLLPYGVSMLMEKPIATTTSEATDMVRRAKQAGIILQVGHVERFNPVMSYIEERLERPRFIEATRLAPYPPSRPGAPPRGTEVSVVLDLMIHDLDILLHIVRSPVESISATGVAVLSPTEDIANARLKFKNGCVANVTASRISSEKLRKIRIFQRDTYLSLDYMKQQGKICKLDGMTLDVSDVPIDTHEPLDAELRSFVDCVRNRTNPVVSGEHGTRSLELAIAICDTIRDNPS